MLHMNIQLHGKSKAWLKRGHTILKYTDVYNCVFHSSHRQTFLSDIFMNSSLEKNKMRKMMTEITAVLERHARVEVKWGMSRERERGDEQWSVGRREKKYWGEESLFSHKTLLQPHLRFHTCRRKKRCRYRYRPTRLTGSLFIQHFSFWFWWNTHTLTEKPRCVMIHQMHWERCKSQQAKKTNKTRHHRCTVNQPDWLDMPANFSGDLYSIWWIYLF